MNKPNGGINKWTQLSIIILVAFAAWFFGEYFFVIFAPVTVYYIWYLYRKTKDLERRLAELEKH